MRPHRIVINAFGPFAERQEIDFDRYDDFILITGPTGSGKTTIFDAIMFALYGELPGTRDPRSVVSNYQRIDTIPSVDLVFSISGERFRIFRTPPYTRLSRRGEERLVQEKPKVELYRLDGVEWVAVPGGPTELNETLQRLLHLSADEFSRIVLLPQGEFEKFLVADSSEKTTLLKKLFPTADHERVAVLAKERAQGIRRDINEKVQQQKLMREEFDPDVYAATAAALQRDTDAAAREHAAASKRCDLAVQEYIKAEGFAEFFKDLDRSSGELAELAGREPAMQELSLKLARARDARPLFPLLDSFRQLRKEIVMKRTALEEQERKLAELRRALGSVQKEAGAIPALEKENAGYTNELARLRLLLPKGEELKRLGRLIEEERRSYAGCAGKRDAGNAVVVRLQETVRKLKEGLQGVDAVDEDHDETMKQLAANAGLLAGSRRMSALLRERAAVEEELAVALGALPAREQEVREGAAREAELQRHADGAAAGRLAARLLPGQPCPVCGSLEHPVPATAAAAAAAGGEGVEEAAAALQALTRERDRLQFSIASLEQKRGGLDNEIAALAAAGVPPEEEAQRHREELEARLARLRGAKGAFKKEREKLAAAERELAAVMEQQERLTRDLNEKEVSLRTIDARIKTVQQECSGHDDIPGDIGKIEDLLSRNAERIRNTTARMQDLQEKSRVTAEVNIEIGRTVTGLEEKAVMVEGSLGNEMKKAGFGSLDDLEKTVVPPETIAAMEAELDGYQSRRRDCETRCMLLREKIGGKPRPDLGKLAAARDEQIRVFGEFDRLKNDLAAQLRDLVKRKQDYDALQGSIQALIAESETLRELDNDLNGKNQKNINFQNFVLSAYLQEVTRYADRRFQVMSEGRYSLLVTDAVTHGSRQAGLDLDVFDAHTGRQRSVKSLSGGEKFLASISLALGLADAIQARAGVIQLDAIFIDEGFGSLDDAALDRALTILDEIRGNRLVGIISHVSELKTRISQQIQVIKERQGSRIRQVV